MTDAVRVGVDVTPLLGPPAGIHQITRGLIDALSRRSDVEVSGWILSTRARRPNLDIPVRHTHFSASVAQRLWSHSGFPSARLIAGKVDVVHGTNFLAPPSPRSVVSIQDLTPITHPEWVRPEVAAMARPLRRAIDAGATLHTSSQAVADDAAHELGVDPSQIAVVHHAVAPVGPGDPARAEELVGGGRFIVALGTVERRKNIPSLLACLPTLPTDVSLVIAGPVGNDEDLLASEIAASASGDRVHRLTDVDNHDRASLLRAAAALVFPSLHEGFGLPPLEALQVGTPVVATAVGVLPELLSDRLELVPPGDAVAFTELLSDTLDAPQVDSELTARVDAMTWTRAAAEMADLYRSLC